MSSTATSSSSATAIQSEPLLSNPPTGSANPSASLPALWGYMQPALDHMIRSPTNNLSKAPAVDVSYHMGIHTALYNYFTSSRSPIPAPAPTMKRGVALGHDVYEQLDKYFAEVASELLVGAPQDDSTLLHYLVPCFTRYAAGATSINRLLNYVNRQYVRRAVDEDKGWLRLTDIYNAVAESIRGNAAQKKIMERMRERRAAELKKWGYVDGDTPEQLARAEACAEAASGPERIVPLLSLAYRRFRLEVMEPLLTVPKGMGKGKKRAAADGEKGGPKGRLARAVKELLESSEGDEEERKRLAKEMAEMLRKVGIRPDHPLRKRLDKYCALVT
ncbi:hypothetical protein BV25DRAFT_447225 [Artomyces pyxidatus]|uniref:Uncharacterized protein n=1 Tax=Artomyces pyxidatus TaxID=48021 RepID=A0ACB8T3P2_9AGAM|nr:hypothetical protein BV25DRAFT_447225 [Artomyces pyxidatus]